MNSLQDFFYMGGHGVYIWSAYLIAFIVITFVLVLAHRNFQYRLRNARRQYNRQRRSAQSTRQQTTSQQTEQSSDPRPAMRSNR